jgi:hypothetical protein
MALTLAEIQDQIKNLGELDTFGTKKEIKSLPEILRDGENIKALTSGFYDGNTWLIVCTNYRLIFLDKGMIYGLKQVDIPLDKVNSVQCETGLFFATVVVWDGASKIKIEQILKKHGKEFTNKVNDALHEYKNQSRMPQVSTTDVASQLMKLAELKEKGVLSEDEFQTQKKKLLAA